MACSFRPAGDARARVLAGARGWAVRAGHVDLRDASAGRHHSHPSRARQLLGRRPLHWPVAGCGLRGLSAARASRSRSSLSEGVGAPPALERFSTGEDLAGRPPVPGLSPALVGTSAAAAPWAQEHAAASRRRAPPGGPFPGGGSPRASPRARSSAPGPGPASGSAVADLRAGGTPRRLADSHELTSRAIEMLAESLAQQGGQLQQVLEQQQLMASAAAAPLPAGALGDGAATAAGLQQLLSQALVAAGSPPPRQGPPSASPGGTALGAALPRAPTPLLGSSVVQRPRGPPLQPPPQMPFGAPAVGALAYPSSLEQMEASAAPPPGLLPPPPAPNIQGHPRPPLPAAAITQHPAQVEQARRAYSEHFGMPAQFVSSAMLESSALGVAGWAARAGGLPPSPSAQPLPHTPAAWGHPPLLPVAPQGSHAARAGLEGLAFLAAGGGDGSGSDSANRLAGARGAAVQEMLRRLFASEVGAYSFRVRERIAAARGVGPWAPEDARRMSACDFLAENVPWPVNAHSLVYLSFGLARVFDEMSLGLWREAEDTVAKLLVACEQASRQDGKFTFAWTLTHLPEPPWGRLLRPGTPGPHNDFALLSDPGWVAAGLAYHRDAQALADLGRGNGGGRGAAGAGAAAKAGAKASAKAAPKRKGKNHKGSEAAAKASDS